MFRLVSLSAPRSFSGVVLLDEEVDCRADAIPLLLARTAALLLVRDAVITAFAFLVGSGRALSTCASPLAAGVVDGSESPMITGRGATWGVLEGGDVSGGVVESISAIIAAPPSIGTAGGGHLSPSTLLLSSRRLALLARSRLLFP